MTGAAEDEVVELASQLIAIDTTNTGEPEGTVGEREAAEYVAGKLTEVGYEVEVLDSGAPGRSTSSAACPGRTASAARCSSTVIWTWCPPSRRSGRCTRSPGRCRTATSGVAARST